MGLHCKAKADGVECRKRLHCFTQALYASISNVVSASINNVVLAARKKREIGSGILLDLPCRVEVDGVECRKRLHCFT